MPATPSTPKSSAALTRYRWYELRSKACPSINFRLLGLKTAWEETHGQDALAEFPVLGHVRLEVRYELLASRMEVARSAVRGTEPVILDSAMFADETGVQLSAEEANRNVEASLQSPASHDGHVGAGDHVPTGDHVPIGDHVPTLAPTEDHGPTPAPTEDHGPIRTPTEHSAAPELIVQGPRNLDSHDSATQIVIEQQKVTWVETLSRLVLSERDHQVIRELKFVASGFGQGLEIGTLAMGVAAVLLQRFYDRQSQVFTNSLVLRKEDLDLPRYLYRFALGTMGWVGLNFFGKGRGYWADYWRDQANYRALLDYLAVPESDLLVFNLEEDRYFRPGFFVCVDRRNSAVVLAIRGTMSMRDAITDLVCEYTAFRTGIIHAGFLRASQWFFDNVGRQLLMFAEEYGLDNIYCTGHSLGGAIASLTCMHLHDWFAERPEGWPTCRGAPGRRMGLHCYAFGAPPTVSESLVGQYNHLIDVFINAEDVVPSLSFGSVLDLHLMLSYAASIGSAAHLLRAIEDTPVMQRLQHCREQILRHSNRINPKLFVLGRIHHMVALSAPNGASYRVVETVPPDRFQEIRITSKAVMCHMPDSYERALDDAYQTFLKSEREDRQHLVDAAISRANDPK